MDDITGSMKDIYSTIKERLTNPFIFSFIIAWFLWNWKITIGLVFYSAKNLESLGPASYWNLITCNSDWNTNLILPGLSALGYTFLFPLVKLGINSFNAWIDRHDQDNVIKISGTGSIPTTEYLKLEKKYKDDINELSENITNSGLMKAENVKLNAQISSFQQNYDEWNKITSLKILQGNWFVQTIGIEGLITDYGIWTIHDKSLKIKDIVEYSFYIDLYICNPFSKTAVIQIKGASIDNKAIKIVYSELKWSDDMQSLESNSPESVNLYRNKPDDFPTSISLK